MKMPARTILLPLLLLALRAVSAAQQPDTTKRPPVCVVIGTVSDSATRQPLRFATVRVIGTQTGAVTSVSGGYILRLPPGSARISFSMVGYRTERVAVTLDADTVHLEMRLTPVALELPSVVVSAEDPGVRLMRRAIRRKLRQQDSLTAYRYTLYTKFVASTDTTTAGRSDGPRDTTIVSIFESFSRGYFRRPDAYFNEIYQRRQSANVPPQANFVAFGTNLNAYDDQVTILGEEIATPFHPDALDYYDFVLDGSYRTEDAESGPVSRIRVTPRGDGRKLFAGWVDLDSERLVPLSVDLQPNRAVRLPFDASLRYQQQFQEVDGKFLMPTGMRITSSLSASLFWILNPRLDIMIETLASDYRMNIPMPEELFDRRRVELAEEAERFDTAYWRDNLPIPLRAEEEQAYDAIRRVTDNPDSAAGGGLIDKTLGGLVRALGTLTRRPFTGFEDIIRYNRVHGLYLGLGLRDEILGPHLEGSLTVGHGLADTHWYGELGLTSYLDDARRFTVEGELYRKLARRDNPYTVGIMGISLGSFLFRNDYGDYYYADGFDLSAAVGFGQQRFIRRDEFVHPSTIRLTYRDQMDRSAPNNAAFALLGGERSFRPDPPVIAGRMRSLLLEVDLGYNPLRRVAPVGLHLAGEISSPRILGSDFDFQQLTGALMIRTRTLPLWRLDLRLSGGISRGALPPQRFYSLESQLSSTAAEGAFRGMSVKEFYGDRFAAATFEHSFGEVIPGVLRIPNLASFGIEMILHGGVGWTAFTDAARFGTLDGVTFRLPSTDVTRERVYYEAGLALNRLLIFLRADVTARLSQTERPKYFFTVSLASN